MDAGPSFSRTLLGLIFIVAGALHFRAPDAYEQIVPPYLPLHRELVYLSGALEIAGGLGLLAERTRRGAGIGLILLLVAVWPEQYSVRVCPATTSPWLNPSPSDHGTGLTAVRVMAIAASFE